MTFTSHHNLRAGLLMGTALILSAPALAQSPDVPDDEERREETVTVALKDGSTVTIAARGPFAPSAPAEIAARADQLDVIDRSDESAPDNCVPGVVRDSAKLGAVMEFQIDVSGKTLWVRSKTGSAFPPGHRIWIRIPQDCPLLAKP